MVTFDKKMYVDDIVKKKLEKFKKKVLNKKPLSSYYIITLPFNSDNCFDIYSGTERWLSEYKKDCDLRVVGLAADKDGIYSVLEDISKDIISMYGTVNKESVHKFFG